MKVRQQWYRHPQAQQGGWENKLPMLSEIHWRRRRPGQVGRQRCD